MIQMSLLEKGDILNTVLSFDEKYDAIGKPGNAYEGLFITAVTSTGIFCRPSCWVRKPKRENVIFYDTPLEALQNGFRPCKLCRPMEKVGETPPYIHNLIAEFHDDPYLRIKDEDLKDRGLEPNQIRRWFKKNHNMTFQTYQRLLRINKAYNEIKGGNSVTGTAFGVGYESLSGFVSGCQSIFGSSPQNIGDKQVINIVRFPTKLGPMFACATHKGLCLLEFTDRIKLDEEFAYLCDKMDATILPGTNPYLDQIQNQVEAYFEGLRKEFTVPLHIIGTPFQKSVWESLRQIPYGSVCSYKQQAESLGNPKAIRAIASTNGLNRMALVIPCHRVIGSDGSMTGYAAGVERKKWLLNFEASNL